MARPAILVVENDPPLREALPLVLRQLGLEVILAETGSGEEALEFMASVPLLDGLYTDIQLSGHVTGWVVGQTFQVLWPTKPIVYASGAAWEPLGPFGRGVFLRKPFDLTALEQVFGPA